MLNSITEINRNYINKVTGGLTEMEECTAHRCKDGLTGRDCEIYCEETLEIAQLLANGTYSEL